MKTNNIIRTALIIAVSLQLTSCDKFLSELPDNRTEIDTPKKITAILMSAYPDVAPYGVLELMSDNVTDAGSEIGEGNVAMRDSYRLRAIASTSFDSPHWIWEGTYKAIASANVALQEAMKYEDKDQVSAQMGEAYLCRAFGHFLLANMFCMAYDPEKCDEYMGIPYVTEPETTVFVEGDRATVGDLYENIAADIEAGFPLIDDSSYTVPLYHFTRRAAAAFAAQFYLYYGKYEKAVEYAGIVLGDDPSTIYRGWALNGESGPSASDVANAYISASDPANIFLQGFITLYWRSRSYRYVHTDALTKEICQSVGPWGNDPLTNYKETWRFGKHYALAKFTEYQYVLNPITNTVQPYLVKVVFSTEKTLIDRAEAYVMLKQYDKAAEDLRSFYESSRTSFNLGGNPAQTISDFYATAEEKLRKPMASRFPVEAGMQQNMLNACLHARRIVTHQEGDRLMDLKRYGIAYTHELDGEDDIQIQPYDLRFAVQIPDMALKAGLTPNPR